MGYLARDLVYVRIGDGKERMGEVVACASETVPAGCVPLIFFGPPFSNWGIVMVPADDLEPLTVSLTG